MASSRFVPGQYVGTYRLLKLLGVGGFGEVWLAERSSSLMARQVALKLPYAPDLDLVRREAQTWIRASGHPNIVPVWEADIDASGQLYIASEYMAGGTLTRWLNDNGGKAPSLPAAVGMMVEILKGVEHLHGITPHAVIHRDLKPDNILLQGGAPRLTDFGISRVMRSTDFTKTISGTPPYMSPEVFGGNYDVTSDLWAAGVIFYRLVTGRLPYPQEDIPALLGAILMGHPDPLPFGTPQSVVTVVSKIFNRSLSERYASASAMRHALEAILQTPIAVPQRSQPPVVPPQVARIPTPPVASSPPQKAVVVPNFVSIPAKEFLMGDNDMRDNRRHTVYLNDFSISKNPITVKQYLAFCDITGYEKPKPPDFNPAWSKEDHPIVNVNWHDATAYCEWLSRETGKKITLPTEAQWEKASRGTEGRRYPWGEDWDNSRLQCSKERWGDAGGTAAVGSYPGGASPYEVLDMAGNVWEWCSDWYDANYMTSAPTRNPMGPATGSSRVLRGGSWGNVNRHYFRCAYRGFKPDGRSGIFGFRCCVSGLLG